MYSLPHIFLLIVLYDDDDDGDHDLQVHIFMVHKNESIENKDGYNDNISLRVHRAFFFVLFFLVFLCGSFSRYIRI